MTSPQIPPDGTERLLDVLELLTKAAGLLALLAAFVRWVAKPYTKWRRERLTEAIKAALEPALEDALRPANAKLMLALERQSLIFDEFDLFLTVVADDRERLDDFQQLLDEVGFASRDRRVDTERRRRRSDEAFAELQGRLRARRRRDDDVQSAEGKS